MTRLKSILFFWLYLLFFTCNLYSQTYFKTYPNNQHYSISTSPIDSIINHSLKNKKFNDAIKVAHQHSVVFYKKKEYKKAIHYALLEIKICDTLHLINKSYVDALYNIAKSYNKLHQLSNSYIYYQKIIDLNTDVNLPKTALSYSALGANYSITNDYYKAADYYKKSIFILEQLNKPKWLFKRYISLANVYERINTSTTITSKLTLLNKALALSESLALTRKDYYSLYNAFASYYNNPETFNFETSKQYQFKYLNTAISHKDSSAISIAYGNLGNLYNEVKNDSAFYFLEKSLCYSNDKSVRIKSLNFIADYHLLKNQYHHVIKNTDSSLSINRSLNSSITDISSKKQFINTIDKFSALQSLHIKSTALINLYQQKDSIHYIEKALQNLKAADFLIDILLNSSNDDQSKLYWQNRAPSIYSKAVFCAQILGKPSLAFYFIEKNKSVLLTKSILANATKAKLPFNLSSKERNLKRQILHLENQLKEEKDVILKNIRSNKLFDIKTSYQKLNDSLRLAYPQYYKRKSKSTLFSLDTIQATLPPDTIILSYIWDTSTQNSFNDFYGIFISPQKTIQFKVSDINTLKPLIRQYHSLISRPFETQHDQKLFNRISHQLYNRLFPEEIRSQLTNKHVLLIPDGDLQSIPFESLLTSPIANHYLIKETIISYAYSMSFLKHNEAIKRTSKNDFIGFSPETFNYKQLDKLPDATLEINTIENMIDGTIFIKENSTVNRFRENSRSHKIIHLATHANATSDPWVAFYDTTLKLHQLYTIPNQAELVVLSSCNSSLGTTINGEGIFSLVRGFFYAGSNAVISSLWEVNDKASSYLMVDFYKNLKKGASKAHALHSAKLNYLASHNLSESSPYYWASFILIGHPKKITFSKDYSSIVIFFVLLILVFSFFIYKKKHFSFFRVTSYF